MKHCKNLVAIELPFKVKAPMLACGADMKGSFALAKGDKAYLVEGFGPLDNPDNLDKYEASVLAHEKRLKIKPACVIHDLHPDYFSSKFARAHALELGAKASSVQHHEAHIASAITEHSIKTDVIGVAFDGTGYGTDGCIWGGEFFTGSPKGFCRAVHLDYMPMPGGEAAVREPYRMAASYIYKAYGANLPKAGIKVLRSIEPKRLHMLKQMIDGRINSPLASSAGRLFDAAASIILSRPNTQYEAELPIALEGIADGSYDDSYEFAIRSSSKMFLIDMSLTIKGIVSDLNKAIAKSVISAKFHNTVFEIISDIATRLRRKNPGLNKVVLSGGVFQNNYLKARALKRLGENGFVVYTQSRINTNDYGIPIGQLAIANVRKLCA